METQLCDRYANRDWARRTFGALADRLGASYLRTDVLADEAVAALAPLAPAERDRVLSAALTRGADASAPAPLRALFAELERIPPWVDFAAIDRGARTYQRTGLASALVLSAYSLMYGYRVGAAVKPLAMTGRLDRMARRRLVETGRFVHDVMQVGGLRRHAPGFAVTVRVRLMHAQVRRMILARGQWDAQAFGAPINQGDMLGTLLEFSIYMLRGCALMGFRFDAAERDAVVHAWRYCGHLSGVGEELLALIDSHAAAERTTALVEGIQTGPDADSVALAAALRGVWTGAGGDAVDRLLGGVLGRYHDGLCWAFVGDQTARDLGTPHRAWRRTIVPTRLVVGAVERARRLVPGLGAALSRLGNAHLGQVLAAELGRKEPTFVAERLA